MPTITSRVSSDVGKGQIPGQTTQRVNSERYDLGLDMAWELDLFGRIQRNLEASDADQQAAEADLYQLQVTMIAELVDAYGQLRGAQLRERIALDNLKNQQESRTITVSLRDAGVGDQLDVERADARLAAVEASVPQLQAEQSARAQPHRHPPRPAPRQAERGPEPERLAGDCQGLADRRSGATAATAPGHSECRTQTGIRHRAASAWPRPTCSHESASAAFSASPPGAVRRSVHRQRMPGPLARASPGPRFDLGSVRARLRGADAEADGALANYEQQVLLALEESENAFSDYGKRQQRLVSLIRQKRIQPRRRRPRRDPLPRRHRGLPRAARRPTRTPGRRRLPGPGRG